MNVTLYADPASSWPNFFRDGAPTSLISMLEMTPTTGESYPEVVHAAAQILVGERARPPWLALFAREEDTPVRRTISFWARHGQRFQPPDDVAEAHAVEDGSVSRVGAARLPTAADVQSALTSPRFTASVRLLFIPARRADVAPTLDWFASLRGPGPRLVSQALERADTLSFALVQPGETQRHLPSLDLYGPAERVRRFPSTAVPRPVTLVDRVI